MRIKRILLASSYDFRQAFRTFWSSWFWPVKSYQHLKSPFKRDPGLKPQLLLQISFKALITRFFLLPMCPWARCSAALTAQRQPRRGQGSARTPPSFSARTRNLYVAPGRRLLTVHSSSGPWYTSETTSSGAVISTLYPETGQPLSDGGTSKRNHAIC